MKKQYHCSFGFPEYNGHIKMHASMRSHIQRTETHVSGDFRLHSTTENAGSEERAIKLTFQFDNLSSELGKVKKYIFFF